MPLALHFLQITFIWSICTIEVVYKASFQKTESNVSRPGKPVPFGEWLNVHNLDVIFDADHIGQRFMEVLSDG